MTPEGSPRPFADDAVADWLLDSDPSIRWQFMRGVAHAPDEQVENERTRET